LTQQVDAQAISQVEVEAFPKAYLCPIGWVVGAVAELRGRFLLTEIPLLVERLRSEPVFLYKGNQATLDYALLQMHALVRSAFLIEKVPRGHTKLEIYTVCSPLSFDGQESFSEKAGLNFPVVFQIIGRDSDARQVVTRKRNASTVTVLNRGTMLFTRLITGEDAQLQPSCGLSNLKNLLMMTAIMQKYHEQTKDHINLDVRKMRRSVAKSFMRLVGCWKSPHFKEMTAPGEKENLGLSKMLVPEERSSIERILEVFQPEFVSQQLNTISASIFGVGLIVAVLNNVVQIPNPTMPQWRVFSVVLALAAALVATTIGGRFNLDLRKRASIAVGGAFVVFLIVYFFVPALAK